MNDFDKGFEFSARHAAAVPAGMDATSWVNSVETAIEELYSAMNSYDHYKNSKAAQDSLKGFLAEEWAFGTANVDAAAALSAALSVAREIYRAIDYLIAEGEIDDEHLKSLGTAACAGAANGFVSGSATAAITAAAAKGAFGETVKAAAMGSRGANVIALLVVLTMETCRNSYLVASGQIELVEMANNMSQSVFSTVMMLGGAAVATALTGGATLPVLIGSFVGGAAGSMAFRPVSSCVMKVCVDSGVTFFGLVEQDYEVSKRLLSMLGIKGASVKTAMVKTAAVSTAARLSAPSAKTASLHTADVAFFERGLVGVNKVAYS